MLRVPDHPLIERIVVGTGFDAADDWIAEASDAGTGVVTADILLADRCLKAGAAVVAPNGKAFPAESHGAALATRRAAQRRVGEQRGRRARVEWYRWY